MLNIIPAEKIENKILLMRGLKVMLDRDLAELYGVETRVLNQAVSRNKKRFPADFMFQLTRMETEYLISQNVISSGINSENKNKSSRSQIVILDKVNKRGLNVKFLPYVFTEQGVAMLSSVLKSERAIEMNIIIMRAFVKIRNLIYSNKDLAEEVGKIKRTQNKHSQQIGRIFETLDKLAKTENNNRIEIGFKG